MAACADFRARQRGKPMIDPGDQAGAVRVWFRFLRLETRMRVTVSDSLRKIGLSVPQCDILSTLTEKEGVSQQDLAKRLYVTKGNISGLIDRLALAGLVERRSIAGDKRQHAIYLTDSGRRAAEAAIGVQHAIIARTFGRLPGEKLAILEDLLIATRDLVRESE